MKDPIDRIGNAGLDLADSANDKLEDALGPWWGMIKIIIVIWIFVLIMSTSGSGDVDPSNYCPDGGWACVRE
jgi:hypothetical protein